MIKEGLRAEGFACPKQCVYIFKVQEIIELGLNMSRVDDLVRQLKTRKFYGDDFVAHVNSH